MIIKLSNLFIFSPLEQFEVTSLLSFNAPILGHISLTLTNLALYSLLILFLILELHYMGNNETKLLPSKWSISLESLFSFSYISSLYFNYLLKIFKFLGIIFVLLVISKKYLMNL